MTTLNQVSEALTELCKVSPSANASFTCCVYPSRVYWYADETMCEESEVLDIIQAKTEKARSRSSEELSALEKRQAELQSELDQVNKEILG